MKESFETSPGPPAVSCLTEPMQASHEQAGRLAQSPSAATVGTLDPRSKGQRSFLSGCKDPSILVWANPCMSGSYGTSLEPDAHMDH